MLKLSVASTCLTGKSHTPQCGPARAQASRPSTPCTHPSPEQWSHPPHLLHLMSSISSKIIKHPWISKGFQHSIYCTQKEFLLYTLWFLIRYNILHIMRPRQSKITWAQSLVHLLGKSYLVSHCLHFNFRHVRRSTTSFLRLLWGLNNQTHVEHLKGCMVVCEVLC